MDSALIISIKRANFNLITSSLLLLALGWPVTVLTGAKVHYFYFLFATIILLLLNVSKKNTPFVIAYCFLFMAVFIYHLIEKGPVTTLLLSCTTYLVIPLVYSKNLITPEGLVRILNAMSFITLLNFLGVVLQLFGVGAHGLMLRPDMALTEGVFHPRYTGFSGGSLALGILSCITLFSGLYHLLITKEKAAFNRVIVIASVSCLLFSFSRRFYVFGLVGVLVIVYIWLKNKKLTLNTYLLIITGLLIASLAFVVVLLGNETIADRLTSIINFTSDEANIGRITRWKQALKLFKNNVTTGLGPGITGTVGRENVTNATVFSAESYYLKILLETGIFVSSMYMLSLIYIVKKCINNLQNVSLTMPITLVIFYMIESFASTSLESPFSSILFWISVAMVHHNRQQLKSAEQAEAFSFKSSVS
jgi:O-antigen ligase